MIFKPKFFLDLSGDDSKPAEPVRVAPVPVAAPSPAKPAEAAVAPAASQPAAAEPPAAAPAASGMTTAEAIAAELAAAQADRPAPSLATFAPECLTPGAGASPRRRRGGANLAGFREIARSYVKS